MNQVHCNLSRDREETLIAYLYDDIDPVVRTTFDEHLATCERCRSEVKALRGVRTQLARWAPPEPAFMRAGSGELAASPPGTSRRASWWREMPAWAQVAAALLFVGVSAGIANLDVRYDRNGLTVHTGWSRSSAPPVSVVPAAEHAEGSAPWRSELAALERQLRAEMHAAAAAPAPVRSASSDAELLRRVHAFIDESERRQRNELALRVGETVAELNARRQAELRNIGSRLRETENKIGIEVMRQRQSLNYLMNVSQRQ